MQPPTRLRSLCNPETPCCNPSLMTPIQQHHQEKDTYPTPPPKASEAATPAPSGSAPARKLAANCSPSGSSAASGRSPGCRIRKSSMRSSTAACSSSKVRSTELAAQAKTLRVCVTSTRAGSVRAGASRGSKRRHSPQLRAHDARREQRALRACRRVGGRGVRGSGVGTCTCTCACVCAY